VDQQGAAYTAASVPGMLVEVLQLDTRFAEERRKVVEEQR
jgi:hypothetical protein